MQGVKQRVSFTESEYITPAEVLPEHVDITASSLLDSVRQILEWDARPRIDVAKRKVIA